MDTSRKNASTLLLPSTRSGAVMLRQKKRRLPVRIIACVLLLFGIISICVVAVGKISDGSVENMLFDKLSGLLMRPDSTFSPPETSDPQENTGGDLPVVVPPLTDGEETSKDESTAPESTQTEPPHTGVAGPSTEKIPEGAILIKDTEIPVSLPAIENQTHRSFDTEYLEAMKSTLLRAEGDAPVCLIIHTHATEGYLPLGTKYYLPSSGELARSVLDSENVVSVGKILADTLNSAGIPTLHVSLHHDERGAGLAYINSTNTINAYLAKYPSIKYVFDLHRSAPLSADGGIIRDSVQIGGRSLARIRLTVSGGSSLTSANVNANLSLALKLNSALCDYSSSLAHPVLISDAVYCDGYAPRTLKIDIGSCASTLQEAQASARILGETIASLLIS